MTSIRIRDFLDDEEEKRSPYYPWDEVVEYLQFYKEIELFSEDDVQQIQTYLSGKGILLYLRDFEVDEGECSIREKWEKIHEQRIRPK